MSGQVTQSRNELDITIDPRPYSDDQDLERMKAVLIAGRKAGGPTYYVHVGDLSWWLRYLNRDVDRRQTIYLWGRETTNVDLIGWSLFSPRFHAFDVFLNPEERGTERAEHIWIWTEQRMCEIVKERGGTSVRTMWVSKNDAQLIALLERRGFVRSDYHLLYLTRSLETPIVESPLPKGYRVRHVLGEHEAPQRAAVAHATFQSGKPAEVYEQRYLAFMRSPDYSPEFDLVTIAPDGRFASFCICWMDAVNQVGLFEPVGTHPDFRRKGLAKAVLSEGLWCMKTRGMATAIVCVEYDNPTAQRLYASLGFRLGQKIYTYAKDV